MTIGKNNAPKTKPDIPPPTLKIKLIAPTKLEEMTPATGMIKKISAKPITKRLSVGVMMISSDSGTNLCKRFSKIANNHTAKITPMIPPWPADKGVPLKTFFKGALGSIPKRSDTAPMTPPNAGVAPNSWAEFKPT